MATTLSTWSFDTELPLKACGIDSETIGRFSGFAPPPEHSMPFVFSKREYEHAFSLSEPEVGLCAAFCCKEAFQKALNEPFNYTDLEIEWRPGNERHKLILDAKLKEQHGILDAQAIIRANPAGGDQLIALVCLFEKIGISEDSSHE